MSSPTDGIRTVLPDSDPDQDSALELPPLPDERWWGDHLRETRWALELSRLLFDPVLRGLDVPRGDGRPVILLPGFGGGDQTLFMLAATVRSRRRLRPLSSGNPNYVGDAVRGSSRRFRW